MTAGSARLPVRILSLVLINLRRHKLLRDLAESRRIAVVLATHERRFAEACHRLLHVRDGRLVEP